MISSNHSDGGHTLEILIKSSSSWRRCNVASSWPLPHLATVRHWLHDLSCTPIRNTDIIPPAIKWSHNSHAHLVSHTHLYYQSHNKLPTLQDQQYLPLPLPQDSLSWPAEIESARASNIVYAWTKSKHWISRVGGNYIIYYI